VNDLYEQALQAERRLTGERWCGQCQQRKQIEGGKYKINSNGHRQRWLCQDCVRRQIERRAERLVAATFE